MVCQYRARLGELAGYLCLLQLELNISRFGPATNKISLQNTLHYPHFLSFFFFFFFFPPCRTACVLLVSQPEVDSAPPALEVQEVLTTGQLGSPSFP